MTDMVLRSPTRRGLHAGTALGLAVAAHVGLAWWLGDVPEPPATAQAQGVGGMLIDLGPSGAAAGAPAPAAEAPQEPAEVPPAEDTLPPEPEPEPVNPVEEEVPQPEPEPQPVEEPEPVEEVLPEEPVEVVETVPEEPPPPPPVRKPPPPKPKAPPPPRPVEPAPAPTPPAPAPAAPATTAAPPGPVAPAAPVVGESGVAGAGVSRDRGTSEAATGGGNPGARRDYLALIQGWLERNKEYPRSARMRRQEGTVMLRFVIDRSGRVLSHRIERGSGHSALDAEVETMIRRASPLPAMPPDVPGPTMEIAVPIVFALR